MLLVSLSSFGQEYLPFPLENAKWTNGYYELNTDNPNFFFFELQSTEVFEPSNDTIINGETYKKVISNNTNEPYAGALRNADGQVFIVLPDSVSEFVLYDFTLNPGDSILTYDMVFQTSIQVVYDTSYSEIGGVIRKVIQFAAGNWIEGIGADRGLFMEVSGNISKYWTHLECFQLDGGQVFSADNADQGCLLSASSESQNNQAFIFPNPSSGEFQIQGIDGILSYQLTDPAGRIVREETSGLNLKFDLREERKGFYLLRIKSAQGWSTHRLILQ